MPTAGRWGRSIIKIYLNPGRRRYRITYRRKVTHKFRFMQLSAKISSKPFRFRPRHSRPQKFVRNFYGRDFFISLRHDEETVPCINHVCGHTRRPRHGLGDVHSRRHPHLFPAGRLPLGRSHHLPLPVRLPRQHLSHPSLPRRPRSPPSRTPWTGPRCAPHSSR